MREYNIIGCNDAQKLTGVLNTLSKDGWRPIGFTMKNLGNMMQSYEVLLERETGVTVTTLPTEGGLP